MSGGCDFGEVMAAWAGGKPAISGLLLIGSRVRFAADKLEHADAQSDWDFQVITSRPEAFFTRNWTRELRGLDLKSYAVRVAAIGGIPKVNAVFSGVEADFVIIPERVLKKVKFRAVFGMHRREGWTRRRMQDLAEVIRPGWRFLKGERRWGAFFRRAVDDVPDPRLSDDGVRQLAEGFVCDYVWSLRKLERGELRTAQRTLFQEMAEANFKLLHELKQRRGERTFTKARRIERIASPQELALVSIEAPLEEAALREALERSAAGCRELVRQLVGEGWRWPEVS
jgi:hypothetical protein